MSALPVVNNEGRKVGQVEFPDALLAADRGAQAMVQAVVTLQANRRAGTASTKTKGEVAGHGQKPWRQKGTGRARAGYRQSPVWRGGGVVFGPKPRSYAKDLSRKTARLALRRAITEKISAEQVTVVDDLGISQPKTKDLLAALKGLKVGTAALIVCDEVKRELALASRNVRGIEVTTAANLNPLQVLRYPRVIFTKPGLERLQARLGGTQES